MAQLKDTVISGSLRVTDTIFGNTASINNLLTTDATIKIQSNTTILGNNKLVWTNTSGTELAYIGASTAYHIGIVSKGNIYLSPGTGSAYPSDNNKAVYATQSYFGPVTTATIASGSSSIRWNGIYSSTGDFSGVITARLQRYGLDIVIRNSAGNQVGEHWYDTGNNTNVTTGVYYWRQFSPNSTANNATTGKYETYNLPAVAAGLAENKTYSILTTKNTVTVAQGGTGATTFASGELLIGNGTSAVGTRAIINNTNVGVLGWATSATTASNLRIVNVNTLAYWNGAYNNTNSNLAYCVKGAFGNACTKGVTTETSAKAISSTDTNLLTGQTIYYGLPTINHAHNYTSSTTIYAPTGAGTAGQFLKASGGNSAPTWADISPSITTTRTNNAPTTTLSVGGKTANVHSAVVDLIYPVGSIYMSTESTSPATLFGGTWAQLKDRFLLGAGDTYTAGATDGAATVTLVENEIPSHNHTFTGTEVTSGENDTNHSHTVCSHSHTVCSHSHTVCSHSHTVCSHSHTGPRHSHRSTGGGSFVVHVTSGMGGYATGSATSFGLRATSAATANDGTGSTGPATPGTNGSSPRTNGSSPGTNGSSPGTNTQSANHRHKVTAEGTIGNTGGGAAHNNMPPYLVVYMWKRTA